MEQPQQKCPKCGGEMIPGKIKFEVEDYNSQNMNPLFSKTSSGGMIPGVYESKDATPFWVEKTGQKTGFIFKSDEVRSLPLEGRRCSLCGFIELYVNAAEK